MRFEVERESVENLSPEKKVRQFLDGALRGDVETGLHSTGILAARNAALLCTSSSCSSKYSMTKVYDPTGQLRRQ